MKTLQDIKNDLSFVKDYKVVVFGSYAAKKSDKRSDIDIAVITGEENREKCIDIWRELMGKAPGVYDIKVFELLPLRIKASVIQRYEVVFGNRHDISEYFYNFRKLWNDTKHRIEENRFSSIREKFMALKSGRRSLMRVQK
ncbi:MAG: nucleotidyltransferase domain-containing protein [Candidatus Methanoperedens sp.]|nr:nucleotidyltransferase domain-containing protein [Candidatus Methanoperedens sp.]